MKALIKFILITLFSTSSFAYTTDEGKLLYRQESLKSMNSRKVIAEPEIYLSNESILRDSEGEDGLYTDAYYTKKDKFRMSLGYSVSGDFEEFSKLSVIDIQVHKKIPSYKDQWFGVQLKRVVAQYSTLADELETSTDPDADGFIKRGTNEQSMTVIGLGYGYRFKAISQMFNSDKVFENIMAFGNYVTHLDSTNSKKYTGFGMTAEYSIQRRMSESLFLDFKIGYNIASVVREAIDDEKKEDRSLIFRWTTLGFDFGYYF